jgi:hypothetical protein
MTAHAAANGQGERPAPPSGCGGPTPTTTPATTAPPLAPGTPATAAFLADAAAAVAAYAAATPTDRGAPVCEPLSPAALEAAFPAAGAPPFTLAPGAPPAPPAALAAAIAATLRFSVRTSHPHYANQLYARPDPAALAAEWVAGAAGAAVHTYEAAPVFTLAERATLAALADRVGGAYAAGHDGLFLPGGAAANAAALALARVAADPAVRTRGARGGPPLVAFVSSHAHFSFAKAAMVAGLGSDNLVAVPAGPDGAMSGAALGDAMAAAAAAGRRPFFIGATAGTTVLGGFDPLPACADLAARHGAWLHVDGAWGGAFLFSAPHRAAWLAGLERSDSWSLSAHKLLGAPPPCAALVTRHPGAMVATYGCSSSSGGRGSEGNGGVAGPAAQRPPAPTTAPSPSPGAAPYLYGTPGARLHADYDLGDKGPGCGRRADAFKLWLLWAGAGDAGLGARAAWAAHLAECAGAGVGARFPALAPVCPPSAANACFWYVPKALRPLDVAAALEGSTLTPAAAAALAAAAPAVKAALQEGGGPLITFTPRPEGGPPFFRLVFPSAWGVVTEDDVGAMLDAVVAAGDGACA